jgi:putrescine transport system permease protein
MSRLDGMSPFVKACIAIGFVFLYAPLLCLMFYSFNDSKLMSVWTGFSFRWYAELFQDRAMMRAALISLGIALSSATAAVVMGTAAALLMTRLRPFRGKRLFGLMVTAPLVMPEVITGLSILLLFVAMGMARGMLTIVIAHITFCAAFVTVVISSRLSEMDKALEEAAQDLGANPAQVFLQITLPIIMPAVASGWLLAFTLSIDDLVISSFVSGPSATTLPMKVFSSVRLGLSPKINALATLLIALVSAAALLAWWLLARDEKRKELELRQRFSE